MRKILNRILICVLIVAFVWGGMLLSDRKKLREGLIRFHVVANSDSERDQMVKLQVRDAVISSIQKDLETVADLEEAKTYIQNNLPKIERIANETLLALGFDERATATLCEETFDVRYYDTFALPAGVYESLRIVIGAGEGKNWWCVAFPSLCIPATSEGFEDTAVGAGFSESLSSTLCGEAGYEIHFFLLDKLGQLENILFQG